MRRRADGVFWTNVAPYCSAGICHVEDITALAVKTVKEPPWHPVLDEHDRGAAVTHGPDLLGNSCQAMGLYRADQEVLLAQLGGVVTGQRPRMKHLAARMHCQAVFPDGFKMSPRTISETSCSPRDNR